MKRMSQAFFFAALLAAVATGLPGEAHAQAYSWTTVTVDAEGDVGECTSIAVDASGDPTIAYYDGTNSDLKFAICDRSASANGNCDQTADWSMVTVDTEGDVGDDTSIAVDVDGDAVISYRAITNSDLKFAICDRSASANGNCDQPSDWSIVTVDAAGTSAMQTSVAVDGDGHPMISYNVVELGLRFAICDRTASTNGNCDQTSDWRTVTVDLWTGPAPPTSIAVDANGDPMIAYGQLCPPPPGSPLKFAICDRSASANGNCDQTADWSTLTVDALGNVGYDISMAVDIDGDPMISCRDNTNEDLKFAICDRSASANGNCDHTADWSMVTVDAEGDVGDDTSIAVDVDGDAVISYRDITNSNLKFAMGLPVSPVGGKAELPDASGSAGRNYIALAGLAAAAMVALTAGAWYARRRWGGP